MASESKVLDVESTVDEFAGALNPEAAALAAITGKRPAGNDSESGRLKTKFARTLIEEYELLPEDEQGQLKWRGDPVETFSDWTIEITSEGAVPAPAPAPELAASTPEAKQPSSMISPSPMATGGAKEVMELESSTQTYHVHRYFLGFGTRRSEYFAKLFRESKGEVSRSTKTTFELEPLAAKAFPDLLDFLYDPRAPLYIETQTATALHHLGVKLEMTHLQHYAKEFIQKDIKLATLEQYYEHANMFEDQLIMDMVVKFIGKNIVDISSTSNFVRNNTDAALWKKALEHVTISATNYRTDLHFSRLIAEFGTANKDKLDAATFQDLTCETKLRKIDPDAAFALASLDDQFSAASAGGEGLSSLQQRCSTALAEIWKELDTSDDVVKDRTTSFLVDLLGKCLAEARSENEKLGGGTGRTTSTAVPTRVRSRADRVGSRRR